MTTWVVFILNWLLWLLTWAIAPIIALWDFNATPLCYLKSPYNTMSTDAGLIPHFFNMSVNHLPFFVLFLLFLILWGFCLRWWGEVALRTWALHTSLLAFILSFTPLYPLAPITFWVLIIILHLYQGIFFFSIRYKLPLLPLLRNFAALLLLFRTLSPFYPISELLLLLPLALYVTAFLKNQAFRYFKKRVARPTSSKYERIWIAIVAFGIHATRWLSKLLYAIDDGDDTPPSTPKKSAKTTSFGEEEKCDSRQGGGPRYSEEEKQQIRENSREFTSKKMGSPDYTSEDTHIKHTNSMFRQDIGRGQQAAIKAMDFLFKQADDIPFMDESGHDASKRTGEINRIKTEAFNRAQIWKRENFEGDKTQFLDQNYDYGKTRGFNAKKIDDEGVRGDREVKRRDRRDNKFDLEHMQDTRAKIENPSPRNYKGDAGQGFLGDFLNSLFKRNN